MKRFLFLFVCIMTIFSNIYSENLFVFLPSTAKTRTINDNLKKSFPGTDIVVFGRFKDFYKKVLESSPDAILTKTPLIKQFKSYNIKAKGMIDNQLTEQYWIISIDKKITQNNLPGKTIGVLDFLGRKKITEFVNSLLNTKNTIKIKRVTKTEDLLPMLTFKMADGILVTEKDINYFSSISNLNFKKTKIKGAKAEIISLATKESVSETQYINCLSKVSPKLLGVDKWK